MQLKFSEASQTDLIDIAVYIAQDSQTRALAFVDDLEKHCFGLVDFPQIGAPRPELGERVRVLPHSRYLIFYRIEVEGILILRILHSARDLDGDDFL